MHNAYFTRLLMQLSYTDKEIDVNPAPARPQYLRSELRFLQFPYVFSVELDPIGASGSIPCGV